MGTMASRPYTRLKGVSPLLDFGIVLCAHSTCGNSSTQPCPSFFGRLLLPPAFIELSSCLNNSLALSEKRVSYRFLSKGIGLKLLEWAFFHAKGAQSGIEFHIDCLELVEEFKNKVMDDFCREKGIKREYSVAKTPQQNGVAERRNRILIEAAKTIQFGKFDGKSDEGFFVRYSLSSKAFRVYNTRTKRVEENLHIGFFRNKPMIEGNGPKWLFDINSLTQSMNYVPVAAVNTASSYDQASPKDMFTMGASHTLEATHVEFFSDEDEPEVDLGNITNSYTVPTTPTTRIHKDHPIENVIGDVTSSIEPISIAKALFDSSWVEAMHEELLQFKLQQIELNMRQRRWIKLFCDYDCEIRYHPGKENVVADVTSRKENRIHTAQNEASEVVDALTEMLRGLDKQMECRSDGA
ncbi:putative ribonuclease H-like domain-containing protein [Tanacetum coccineum]